MFGEHNCIKYGNIKYKECVYISQHKVQGTEPMNSLYREKVNSWAYKNVLSNNNNRNAHQSNSEVSIHSCYNNKTWIIRELTPRADEVVVKPLYFAGGTGYVMGFGTCLGIAFLPFKL